MQNFGPQQLAIGSQTKYFTGVGWEYLTIGNESPYILDANFSGIGSITIPAWSQEDIRIPSGYTGQIVLTPNNYLGLTQIVSQLVYVNGFNQGELPSRQAYALSQNFGNIVTSTATNLVNDGNPAGTTIIESTQAGSTGSNILVKNNGTVFVSQFSGGTLTQLFGILPGVSAGLFNANVVLSDSAHATQVNGSLLVNGGTWAYGGITTQTSSTNLTAIGVNLSGTSTQNGVVVTPQNGTRNFTDFFASGAEINTVGVGYNASGLNQGLFSNSNVTGIAFQGTHATAGIDLTGITTAGSGPAILAGDLPIKAKSGSNLLLDTVSSGNSINLDIAGTIVAQILAGSVNLNQLLSPNVSAQSTQNGSVSGQAVLWCPIWGSGLKFGWINLQNNFQTASNVTLLFPTPQVNFAWYYSGDISGTTWVAQLGASVAAMRHTYSIGASGQVAGSSESVNPIKNLWVGQFLGSDRVVIQTTAGGNINSFMWFIGQ